MKTVRLEGVFLIVGQDCLRWSLTDAEGYTSYATAKPKPDQDLPAVGDRFRIELDYDERGDVVASRYEAYP